MGAVADYCDCVYSRIEAEMSSALEADPQGEEPRIAEPRMVRVVLCDRPEPTVSVMGLARKLEIPVMCVLAFCEGVCTRAKDFQDWRANATRLDDVGP